MLLLKDIEHLALFGHGAQLTGLFGIRHADEESFAIGDEVKQSELSCAEEKCAVEIVDGVVEYVVMSVEIADALEQLHFARESLTTKHLYSLGGVCGDTTEGNIHFHNFCHALTQLHCNLRRYTTFYFKMAIVTSCHRSADAEVRAGEEVASGFVKHKKEAARVSAQT